MAILEYMKALFEDRDHDRVFQRFFQLPFPQYLRDFRSAVQRDG